MDIPARYIIAQQNLEARESERIDFIKLNVHLDNIKKLRKTDSMIRVKVIYKYRDDDFGVKSITSIFDISQYDINGLQTTLSEIKKIFLPKDFYDSYMFEDTFKNRIDDKSPVISRGVIYLVEKPYDAKIIEFEEKAHRKERQRKIGDDNRRIKRARESEVVDLIYDVVDLTGDDMDMDIELDGLKKKKSRKRKSLKKRKVGRKSRSKRKRG